jgi:3-hydroxyisobutyrate dehydrogenase-like beta-hydroxyacid dehydrogenase
MGEPMCRRLLGAGYDVLVHDLDTGRTGRVTQEGARIAASAAGCASQVDLLLTSLPQPAHVRTVMADDGALAALRAGSTWIDLTTNQPALLRELAAVAPAGVCVADAPVTGAVDGARTGRLTLFVGGPPRVVARVTPVLAHLGAVVVCGELGHGCVVKLVTNQLWFVAAAALGEAFAVGVSHGVELSVLWTALCNSVADSFVVRHDAPSIFAGHYDPSFTLDLCRKDLRLLAQLQEAVDTDLPLTDAARAAFALASDRYGDDAGELHVARRIEDDAGLSFRLDGAWTPPWEVTDAPADNHAEEALP